jgi:hypothetical protein
MGSSYSDTKHLFWAYVWDPLDCMWLIVDHCICKLYVTGIIAGQASIVCDVGGICGSGSLICLFVLLLSTYGHGAPYMCGLLAKYVNQEEKIILYECLVTTLKTLQHPVVPLNDVLHYAKSRKSFKCCIIRNYE